MGTTDRTIAVIVINYGTADLAIEAVESVLDRTHGGRTVDVHLVDNASPGGDAARLSEAHASRGWERRVTLWLEAENHGFGRGNNVVLAALAARRTPPDYVFLLNPDAQLENEAIAALAGALDGDPAVGAAGAAMRGAAAQPIAAAFRFPTGWREVFRTLNFGPLSAVFPDSAIARAPETPAGPVDWVTGAAVMLRFSALQQVGFFDPRFFLYYEEVELMHRLSRAGWVVVHVPAALVRHEEGAATQVVGASRYRPAYVYRSQKIYQVLTAGRARARLTAMALLLAGALNIVQRRLRGKAPTVPSGFLRDHWRYVLRPLLTVSE